MPSSPIPGKPITGKVVSIRNSKIIVEMDGAYVGIIGGREACDGFDTAKNLSVGDEVKAYVVEDENDEGYYILSLRKAGREKAWDKLAGMAETPETVEVVIKAANKGGLMTEFSGIRAFIPVSQLSPENYPRVSGANSSEILSRLQKLVGEKLTVSVLAADANENKLIFSEKAGLSGKREAAIKKLKVGDKIKGKVSGVVNFGIFILFNDCLEGLVHLSEIAWGRVSDAANYARLGEEKEAVVIGIDESKISLSMRRLTTDPWLEQSQKYEVGDTVEGIVDKITAYGALVKLEDDLNGLLHTSEFAKGDGEDAEITLEAGDKVEAKIIEINPEEHRIALSMKTSEEKPKINTPKPLVTIAVINPIIREEKTRKGPLFLVNFSELTLQIL
jgi:ribosomal protein S1